MQNDGGRRPRANYETTRQPEVAGLRPETGDGPLRRPIDRGLKDEETSGGLIAETGRSQTLKSCKTPLDEWVGHILF